MTFLRQFSMTMNGEKLALLLLKRCGQIVEDLAIYKKDREEEDRQEAELIQERKRRLERAGEEDQFPMLMTNRIPLVKIIRDVTRQVDMLRSIAMSLDKETSYDLTVNDLFMFGLLARVDNRLGSVVDVL